MSKASFLASRHSTGLFLPLVSQHCSQLHSRRPSFLPGALPASTRCAPFVTSKAQLHSFPNLRLFPQRIPNRQAGRTRLKLMKPVLLGNGRRPVPYLVAKPFEISVRWPRGTPQRAFPTIL